MSNRLSLPFALLMGIAAIASSPAHAAPDAVVQPLATPGQVPPGPICVLPPLMEEPPSAPRADGAVADERRAPSTKPAGPVDHPLLCACLPLDVLMDEAYIA